MATISDKTDRNNVDLIDKIEELIELLEKKQFQLQVDDSTTVDKESVQSTLFPDGRYTGGNQKIHIDLRVDEKRSGVISADIYRTNAGGRKYTASIRTVPSVQISRSAGSWKIIGTDRKNSRITGHLSLTSAEDDTKSLVGSFSLDEPLGTLPVHKDIRFTAKYRSKSLRNLGIELEREENIKELPTYQFEGRNVSVESALRATGLQVTEIGERSVIPKPDDPWNGWDDAELHTLMMDFAQASLAHPTWELHLLLLSQAVLDGLLGVMFDIETPLPRQGAAVFAGEIQQWTTSDHFPRKLIQTTLHELGHSLNLAHRFEREVGRADSTSTMNYDWRYKGGGRKDEFWQEYDFGFDSDELEFLRHAPKPAVMPGGEPFRTIRYWKGSNGGYSPYVPETDIDFLKLALHPPQNGHIFEFAQPVFLTVELTNISDHLIKLHPQWLDPKAGMLEIQIRKRDRDDEAQTFDPITTRCYDLGALEVLRVESGNSIANNLNLTFGSAGFPFAEPGEYEVRALLAFYDPERKRELVVRSDPLNIRIRYPQSRDEEDDAQILLREDVGLYFALGGSRVLSEAHEDLEKIRDRRRSESEPITDPIVASITRCQAFDIGRSYVRYQEGEFEEEQGDQAQAEELLEELGPVLEMFDPHTATHTQEFTLKPPQAEKNPDYL